MLQIVLIAAAVVGITGLILGALIAVLAKKFAVNSDPRIAEVTEELPGANCGGCGFAGCADLAKNIVEKDLPASTCPVSSDVQISRINKLLGRTEGVAEKKVAVVLCSGSLSKTKRAAFYNGITDCRTAAIVAGGAGSKGCRFGCLGYGSCAKACPFGAIEIIDGLAVVHTEICKGCGRCVGVCPRKLIKLVPAETSVHVYCNSLEKPAVKRKYCSALCLACQKCVKLLGKEKLNPQGFLMRVIYTNPPSAEEAESVKCPTNALCTVSCHKENILKALKKEETPNGK